MYGKIKNHLFIMKLRFLNKKESAHYLRNEDDFISRLSPFDRSSRLKSDSDISQEQFIDFISKQALNFGSYESSQIETLFNIIENQLDVFSLNFPDEIYMIKTTGREEGNAAYTRGPNAIILPQSIINTPYQLKNILLHELFHVYSKNNPKKKEKFYRIIGFQPTFELEFPQELMKLKITNPDAPYNNFFFHFDERDIDLIPIIFARESYSRKKVGEFFAYLQFRFISVEMTKNRCMPLYKNNKLELLHDDDLFPNFNRITCNTDYIIHPEEILAENFVLLLNGSRNIKNLKLLELMKHILKK
jgi:hypothetical protein